VGTVYLLTSKHPVRFFAPPTCLLLVFLGGTTIQKPLFLPPGLGGTLPVLPRTGCSSISGRDFVLQFGIDQRQTRFSGPVHFSILRQVGRRSVEAFHHGRVFRSLGLYRNGMLSGFPLFFTIDYHGLMLLFRALPAGSSGSPPDTT